MTNLCVWCADANGQLGSRKRENPKLNKIIGMNNMARTTEPGNGKRVQDLCIQRDLIPMTTWKRQPKQTKHEPGDISTRVHPCVTIRRQIDYIMVSRKYRNCVRRAHVIQEFKGNPEPQRQQAAVKLEICLHLKKEYFTTPKQDAGNEVEYDLKKLRAEPKLLEQHCRANQIGFQYQTKLCVTQNWENMKNIARRTTASISNIEEK